MSDITNANQIIHLPFDEAAGSSVAYDYSPNRYDGTITGDADFVPGKAGNCLQVAGEGECNLPYTMDLKGDLTLLAWVRRDAVPADVTWLRAENLTIYFHGSVSDENSVERSYPISEGSWNYWAITKEGLTAKIYENGNLVDELTLTEQPDFITMMQDGTQAEVYASVDDLVLYDRVLTTAEMASVMEERAELRYYIGYTDIREKYGIRFESSDGLLSRPKLKPPTKVDWPDYHGEVIDLTNKRVEARSMTLKGWMPANGKLDFVRKWNDFVGLFEADGTQRLMVSVHPTKPLVYEVYMEDEINPSKTWSDELMVGTFTLKLKEPDPVKRVLRQLVTDSTNNSLRVRMKSSKAVTIAWGDGTYSEDLSGTIDLTHYYTKDKTASGDTEAGTYYCIVSGVIEEITEFSTTGIIVWNKL